MQVKLQKEVDDMSKDPKKMKADDEAEDEPVKKPEVKVVE